jgi:DNA-binding IscR family transcriptional regulator
VHGAASADDPDVWEAACAVRDAWHAATEASQRVLDTTTIRQLVEAQELIRARRQACLRTGVAGESATAAERLN